MQNIFSWIRDHSEEIIVMGILLPLAGFAINRIIKKRKKDITTTTGNTNTATVNFYNSSLEKENKADKEKKVEHLRSKVSILFIDDDTKFKVISILKNAGWLQTKIIRDLKNLNEPNLLNAHIVFVDIQGVGKLMGFTDEGLGLAAGIKERYPEKKVIIYSADSEGSRFHKAFRLADDQLSKNAVPYEFETVIETMTSQLIANGVF